MPWWPGLLMGLHYKSHHECEISQVGGGGELAPLVRVFGMGLTVMKGQFMYYCLFVVVLRPSNI